jgi:hypothetical protein
MVVGGFWYLFLGVTLAIPSAVCVMIALPACWLLSVREIPIRVRQTTAAIELLACAQFSWMLHALKVAFQNRPFWKALILGAGPARRGMPGSFAGV